MTASGIESGLALLVSTFRADLDSYQVRAYKRALAGIDAEIVLSAADHLIDQAANGRKFYPLPSAPEWKAACQVIIARKRKAAFEIGVGGCDHPSYLEEYQDERGVWWTRRCRCYQRGKQLMDAAGQPLALPDVPDRVGGED